MLRPEPEPARQASELSTEEFLEAHWSHPIPPQGAVPAEIAEPLVSLDPGKCGSCHLQQWQDWNSSKHSQAMGQGLLWQLPLLGQHEGNKCLRCHAPLAEQKALQALQLEWKNAPDAPPPGDVPGDLNHGGLVCAACHLRKRQVFGPPPREGTTGEAVAHKQLTRHPGFENSRFCATCHQFPDDGPRVNGKLQEDTYQQWLESPSAAKEEHCQHCHMPDRRHLWRGIHDRDMVSQALEVKAVAKEGKGDSRHLHVVLKNVGAGHHLPTYMVPKLLLRLMVIRESGQQQLVHEERIGWQVNANLQTEYFDTRIPAGEQLALDISLGELVMGPEDRLELTIDVHPREHYERMFMEVLRNPDISGEVKREVQAALDEARSAHYQLMRRRIELDGIDMGASRQSRIAN
jgi:hypothetical protein